MEQGMVLAGSGSSAIWQTAFWLLVVIALILVMAWVARRFSAFGHLNNHGRMKVLATMPVGNRERVVLIQVGQQCLLLGVAPNKVNTLHVFDPADELSTLLTNPDNAVGEAPFQALLQRTLFQNRKPDTEQGITLDKAP